MESIYFEFLSNWSYCGLFVVLLLAGMGLPIPEDIPLIFAGFLVSQTHGSLLLMMATGFAGVLAGDSALFFLGRRYGMDIVKHRWFRRVAKPWLLDKAKLKYQNHGAKIMFAARFMPGLRAVLFLTAGMFRVSYITFIAFDGCAALISVPVWIWAGWHFSGKISTVFASAKIATYVTLGILGVALIIWAFWEYHHNLRVKNASPESSSDSQVGILGEASASLISQTASGRDVGQENRPDGGVDQPDSSSQTNSAEARATAKPCLRE